LIARLSVVRDTLAEQHEKANRIYQTILTEISHQTNKMKVEENPGYKNIAISSIRERWKELNALNMDLLDGTLEDNIAAVRTVQKDVTHLLLSEHLQEPLTSEDRVFLSVAQTDLSNLLGPLMRKKYGEVQGSSDEESDAPSFKERHQGRLDAGDDTEEPGDPYQKL
ncbi:MAG: hypothetical protein K0U10_06770, partial [Gammaproteobacteria bacterium]|nr:hypothetical protein [Gammaproteobacteria bacterium]